MRRVLLVFALWWMGMPLAWATNSIVFGNPGRKPDTAATTYTALVSSEKGGIAGTWNPTEANVFQGSSAAGSYKNLYVEVVTAPGAGTSYAFTVMVNAAATALTCTISGTATSCSDTTHTGAVTAGQTVSLRSVPSGTPGDPGAVRWNITFGSTTAQETGFNSLAVTPSTSAANYISPASDGDSQLNETATEANAKIVSPMGGTLKNLYVSLSRSPANGGGTQTYTFAVDVNGVASAITCAISETGTSCNDTTHTAAIVAGDLIDISITPSGTPRTVNAMIGLTFLTTTNGDYMIPVTTMGNTLSTSATNYLIMSSGSYTLTDTESAAFSAGAAVTIKNIYVVNRTAPSTGKSYAYTLRVNSANASPSLTCTVSDSGTTCNAAATVTTADFDDLDTSVVPSGTPTASTVAVSYLGTTAAAAARQRILSVF